jgi:hypothetical protein
MRAASRMNGRLESRLTGRLESLPYNPRAWRSLVAKKIPCRPGWPCYGGDAV